MHVGNNNRLYKNHQIKCMERNLEYRHPHVWIGNTAQT